MEGFLDASAFSPRPPPLGRDGLSCKIDRQKSSVIDLTSPGCSDHRVPRLQNVRERKCGANPGQPIRGGRNLCRSDRRLDRKSIRLNSSHQIISYAVFCLKKKKTTSKM